MTDAKPEHTFDETAQLGPTVYERPEIRRRDLQTRTRTVIFKCNRHHAELFFESWDGKGQNLFSVWLPVDQTMQRTLIRVQNFFRTILAATKHLTSSSRNSEIAVILTLIASLAYHSSISYQPELLMLEALVLQRLV